MALRIWMIWILNPLLITVDGAAQIVYDRNKPRNPVPDTLDAEIVRDAARFLEDGEKMQLSYAVQNTHRTCWHAHL